MRRRPDLDLAQQAALQELPEHLGNTLEQRAVYSKLSLQKFVLLVRNFIQAKPAQPCSFDLGLNLTQ